MESGSNGYVLSEYPTHKDLAKIVSMQCSLMFSNCEPHSVGSYEHPLSALSLYVFELSLRMQMARTLLKRGHDGSLLVIRRYVIKCSQNVKWGDRDLGLEASFVFILITSSGRPSAHTRLTRSDSQCVIMYFMGLEVFTAVKIWLMTRRAISQDVQEDCRL
jgi:hypothetical protein